MSGWLDEEARKSARKSTYSKLCLFLLAFVNSIQSLVKLVENLKVIFTRCPQDVVVTAIYVLIVRQNHCPDGRTLLNIHRHRQDDDNNERCRFFANSGSCEKRIFVIIYHLEVEVNICMLHIYICFYQVLDNSP